MKAQPRLQETNTRLTAIRVLYLYEDFGQSSGDLVPANMRILPIV